MAGYGLIVDFADMYDSFKDAPRTTVDRPSYVYLNTVNVLDGQVITRLWSALAPKAEETSHFVHLLSDRIYTNGGSEVYFNP